MGYERHEWLWRDSWCTCSRGRGQRQHGRAAACMSTPSIHGMSYIPPVSHISLFLVLHKQSSYDILDINVFILCFTCMKRLIVRMVRMTFSVRVGGVRGAGHFAFCRLPNRDPVVWLDSCSLVISAILTLSMEFALYRNWGLLLYVIFPLLYFWLFLLICSVLFPIYSILLYSCIPIIFLFSIHLYSIPIVVFYSILLNRILYIYINNII